MPQKAKPHRLKVLGGTNRKKGALKSMPPPAIKLTICPRYVGKHGRKFHKENAPLLMELGVIRVSDWPVWFAEVCQRFHRIVTYEEILNRDGPTVADARGSIKKHPVTTLLKNELTLFEKAAARFALDPQSRGNMGVDIPKGPDPYQTYLRRKKKSDDDLLAGASMEDFID